MSKEQTKFAVELCSLLVDEIYGELSSRIFTILLRRGRLNIRSLMRHTQMNSRQLKHGLAVLVQQNLAYHSLEKDGSTYYEAKADAAYALIRSGKIIETAENLYGPIAKDLVEQLVLLGNAKVSDIIEGVKSNEESQIKAKVETTTNGAANGITNGGTNGAVNGDHHTSSTGQMHTKLIQLLEEGLVLPVKEEMFRSPTDTFNTIEQDVLRINYGGSTRGTKQKDELRVRVRKRMQELRDEVPEWRPKGYKLQSNRHAINGAAKRRKIAENGTAINGNHDGGYLLDDNLVLRINHEKFAVLFRNERLVQVAETRIGVVTSQIYAELLRLLSEKLPRCRPDPQVDDPSDYPDPSITTKELSEALSPTINVALGIGKASRSKVDTSKVDKVQKGKKKKADDETEVEGEASPDEESEEDVKPSINGNGHAVDADEDSDDPFEPGSKKKKRKRSVTFEEEIDEPVPLESREARMMHVMNHLQLLAADNSHLLSKVGTREQGEWTVEFPRVIESVREMELDNVIFDRFGSAGRKLVRILRKFGKLEEKHLPNMALMRQKDIREKMVEMQMAGLVDVQEVPRDPQHTPARTIFLWFLDLERVKSITLNTAYKAMARLLQRLEKERQKRADTLAMAERTDVKGKEATVLKKEQHTVLLEMVMTEQDVYGEIMRLDEFISLFRDY